MKKNSKVGDVFCVEIGNNRKKYFQCIATDLTQLNSDVIRAFRNEYSMNDSPNIAEIVNGVVEFYAHCITKWGVKLGYWKNVGNTNNLGKTDILFRDCSEELSAKIAHTWWIWRVNRERKKVGMLMGENRLAEIGVVVPADSIVFRMKTGKYDFVYPDFE